MDERDLMDDLDAFLDRLSEGEPEAASSLEAALAETARAVDRTGRRPAPNGAKDRVWRRLTESQGGAAASTNGQLPSSSAGQTEPIELATRAPKRRPRRSRWWTALDNLAAAALVGLALLGTLIFAAGGLPDVDLPWREPDGGGRVAMPRGGPSNTGELDASGPEGEPVERWRFQLPAGTASYAAPVVTDDTIYVAPPGGTLVAVDRATGERRWQFRGPGNEPVSGAPAVAEGVLYVGLVDGTLYALDALTGQERWRIETAAPFTSPVVSDGTIFLSANTTQGVYPVVAGDLVFIGGNCGCDRLVALDAATGSELWTFASDFAWLHAVSAKTGQVRWQVDGVAATAAPAVANGTIYAIGDDGSLVALDAATGTERWRRALTTDPGQPTSQITSPTVAGEGVFIALRDGTLIAFDQDDGAESWRMSIGASVAAALVAAGDVLYLGGLDGVVRAVDADTGAELWTFTLDGWVSGPLAVAGGQVYVADHQGVLYALGDAQG
jgi:outer membrane protein assembly factor BamB